MKSYNELYHDVLSNGMGLFENQVKLNTWMGTPNKNLGDLPVNFLSSYSGLELVESELNRIKLGL